MPSKHHQQHGPDQKAEHESHDDHPEARHAGAGYPETIGVNGELQARLETVDPLSIRTTANNAITKEKKYISIISGRIKNLCEGNKHGSKGFVTAEEVLGGPASTNSKAHVHVSEIKQSADTIAQPWYPASTTVQYKRDEGSSRTASQYNIPTNMLPACQTGILCHT